MSSSFTIPPLTGETYLSVREVARRAGCSEQAVYLFIHGGRLAAVKITGRFLIAESEAERFVREWESNPHGMAAHWRQYRAWKQGQRAAQPTEAVA
jgi:excisionase family DNA binding protein